MHAVKRAVDTNNKTSVPVTAHLTINATGFRVIHETPTQRVSEGISKNVHLKMEDVSGIWAELSHV